MTDPIGKSRTQHKWLWAIVVTLIVLGAMVWFAKPLGMRELPSGKPVAQSTEWASEPAGSAVPVELPKTPMTNAPADQAQPASKAGQAN